MWKNICPWISVPQFEVDILKKKVWIVPFWMSKGRFTSHSRRFGHLCDFYIFPILVVYYSHFCSLYGNLTKNMYRIIHTQNLLFDLFELVTSDDLGLIRGHQMLRRATRSIPDTINAVTSVLFQFDMAAFPGESSDDRWSKCDLWPDLWRHQWYANQLL